MTVLTIFSEDQPDQALETLHDHGQIARALAAIGVPFAHWQADALLAKDASPEAVIAAYQPQVDALNQRYGFQSMDVVAMYPEHPQAATARGKFLSEHTHDDFEIRFFVDGSGIFYIRSHGKVYATHCMAGDLIELPANLTHWFDMGTQPFFKAIRFFTKADGWVGNFTGDQIADRFPKFDQLVGATNHA